MNVTAPTPAAAAPLSRTGAAPEQQASEDRFLRLLVAQLQNQDPLSPMDNAQVTSQLAQISAVNGINTLNQTVLKMAESFAAAQATQSAALIGRTVWLEGNTVAAGQSAGMQLPSSADRVVVEVLDAGGKPLREINLGAQAAGFVAFSWDGLTTAGTRADPVAHRFQIKATAGGEAVEAAALIRDEVAAVTLNGTETRLSLRENGLIELAKIRQIAQ